MFLESPWGDQKGNVGKVGKVGNVEKIKKVGKWPTLVKMAPNDSKL